MTIPNKNLLIISGYFHRNILQNFNAFFKDLD